LRRSSTKWTNTRTKTPILRMDEFKGIGGLKQVGSDFAFDAGESERLVFLETLV
jgi:hypothetical protein